MVVREIKNPSPKEFEEITRILTDAFWRTPLFTDFLFRGRKPLARSFMAALARYGFSVGRMFVTEDAQGIAACALWSLPDSPPLNLRTYLKTGMWPLMLWIALRSPLAMRRINELLQMLERYAPEGPCATLEFLASARQGAGAAAVWQSMEAFAGQTLYVESIVGKNDHAFYRQFGFEPFARVDFHGTDYAFMLAQPRG